jgi:hypothetical protein
MDRDFSHLRAYYGVHESTDSPISPSPRDESVERSELAPRNPFADRADSAASQRSHLELNNPFASPLNSRPPSTFDLGSAIGSGRYDEKLHRYFRSRRVKKGEVDQPWLKKKDPREKWVTILPLVGIFIGLCISAFLVYDGMRSVVQHNYCQILAEDWINGLNPKVWQQEVQVGGFGYVIYRELRISPLSQLTLPAP